MTSMWRWHMRRNLTPDCGPCDSKLEIVQGAASGLDTMLEVPLMRWFGCSFNFIWKLSIVDWQTSYSREFSAVHVAQADWQIGMEQTYHFFMFFLERLAACLASWSSISWISWGGIMKKSMTLMRMVGDSTKPFPGRDDHMGSLFRL